MRAAFKCVAGAACGATRCARSTCGASSAVHCWQSSSTAAAALAGRMAAVALLHRSQKRFSSSQWFRQGRQKFAAQSQLACKASSADFFRTPLGL